MNVTRTLVAAALLAYAFAASGDRPETPPAGMGKYVIVLWSPGTPVPGAPEKRMPDVPEPDVAGLGGRLLHRIANRRVVYLPFAAAEQLQRHEAVASVQRIWVGEPLDDWNEQAEFATGPKVGADADTGLQWGPKSYSYDGSGNIKKIGTDEYTYDSAGRLIKAKVNGKTETYRYDAFGNLAEKAVSGANPVQIAVDPGSNRLIGPEYDAAGNVTTRDGRARYTDDSLNMLSHYEGASDRRILYDADDERIGTIIGSLSRWTIRGLDGQILREYRGDDLGLKMLWFWEQDHIRGEGQLLGGETQQWGYNAGYTTAAPHVRFGGERHYHLDHLGSVRMVTNQQGRSLSEHDYYPFGTTQTKTYQEPIHWGDPHIDGMRFAGHWRDYLGHLDVEGHDYIDNMHARSYDPNMGRFLSVDPILGAPSRPQSWNRYSYVENNPLGAIDPTGMKMECVTKDDGTEECTVIPDEPLPDPLPLPPGEAYPESLYHFMAFAERRDVDDVKRDHAHVYWREFWNPTQIYGGTVMWGGGGNAAQALLGTSRVNLLQNITNPRLRNLINQLFRANARVGTGSTADAIRYEAQTGAMLSRAGHFQKGLEMRTALMRVLREESLSAAERQAVRSVLIDLQKALSGL